MTTEKPAVVDDVDEVIADNTDDPSLVQDPDEVTADRPDVESTEGDPPHGRGKGKAPRWIGWCRAHLRPILLTVLVVAAAALAAVLFFFQYRPDQQTDSAAAQDAIRAAKDGTVALLSYSPDSLDHDFTTAKSHLTGDFLSYYNQFTEQIVAPAAKQKAVKTSAGVVQAGVSELHPDKAVVLVFVNQTTTSSDRPDPSMTASSVLVTVTKVKGAWLISAFDPV
jgi:Mce-associated membrane protein